MKNATIKFGADATTFSNALKSLAKASGIWSQPNKVPAPRDWSAKMCERIDRDNFDLTGRPTFCRRILELPALPTIRPEHLFEPVAICFLSSGDQMLHQHLRFKQQTLSQMSRCGFAIDFEDEDGHVNFSRWIDASQLQICRIEFL